MDSLCKVVITGDFFVSNTVEAQNVFSTDVVDFFNQSDFNILNFEAPLVKSNSEKSLDKTGPSLKMSQQVAIKSLQILKSDLLTLANNHIMDYGVNSLDHTIETLKENKFDVVGAGMDKDEASTVYYRKINDITLGVINVGENEWGVANDENGGMNGFDIIETIKKIKEAKKRADKVILIYHGGNEYYEYPRPNLVKTCRFLAEQGADLIACHHTHKISGYEIYKDVPIFYGLGNFLFTRKSGFDSWYSGLIVELHIKKNEPILFDIKFVKQDKKTFFLDFDNQKNNFEQIQKINSIIESEVELLKAWKIFCKSTLNSHYIRFTPIGLFKNNFLRKSLTKLGVHKFLFNSFYKRNLLNRIRCEAHRDVLLEILKQ